METANVGTDSGDANLKHETLVKLLRSAIKCFYQPQDLLIIDLIIKEKYATAQRLESVLKLDIKLVRVSLATLKNDRLISKFTRRKLTSDNKMCRFDYYRIKHENLVDVIRFKLDQVQIRVESLERESMCKESFKCTRCHRTWTDLEAGELFNRTSLRFCCTQCRKPVEGVIVDSPEQLRQFMAKFNVEVSPIYDLLKQWDDLVSP